MGNHQSPALAHLVTVPFSRDLKGTAQITPLFGFR